MFVALALPEAISIRFVKNPEHMNIRIGIVFFFSLIKKKINEHCFLASA